jgi:hypothetical protein
MNRYKRHSIEQQNEKASKVGPAEKRNNQAAKKIVEQKIEEESEHQLLLVTGLFNGNELKNKNIK